MYKLFRWYNQNRTKILGTIIAIIFVIAIIRILNEFAKDNDNNTEIEETNQVVKYENESKAIISNTSVSNVQSEKFGSLIDDFLSYCVKSDYNKAYELLSSDCKRTLYPDINLFKTRYCESKFSTNKTYSFQSWTSTDIDVYKVKIFDDILSTGIANSSYIEDYYSVVYDNGVYKLNINNYIDRKNIDKINEENGIEINIQGVDIYMEYEIYTISIANKTDNTILLDTKSNSKSLYVVDKNYKNHTSLLNENTNSDLIVTSGETKKIQIKFTNTHIKGSNIKKVVFSDIVPNYNRYKEDKNYDERIKIEVNI